MNKTPQKLIHIRVLLRDLNNDWEKSIDKFGKETARLLLKYEAIANLSKEYIEEYRALVGHELDPRPRK